MVCGSSSEYHNRNPEEKFKGDSFKGPVADRSCTDVLCTILFLAFLVGMFIVAGIAVPKGDPPRLYKPTEYTGLICGVDNNFENRMGANPYSSACIGTGMNGTLNTKTQACQDSLTAALTARSATRDMTSRPFLLYFSLSNVKNGGICVSQCPEQVTTTSSATCPTPLVSLGPLGCAMDPTFTTNSAVNFPTIQRASITATIFPAGLTDKSSVFSRCAPMDKLASILNATAGEDSVVASSGDASEVWSRLFGDIIRSWRIILICTFIAFTLGYIWVFLLKKVAGFMVWVTLILVGCVLAVIGAVFSKVGKDRVEMLKEEGQPIRTAQAIQAFGGIFLILAAIYFFLMLFLCRRISKAIAIIKETSRAVGDIPAVIFVPFPFFLLLASFAVYWIAISLFIVSAGNPAIDTTLSGWNVIKYKMDQGVRNVWYYHLFGWFWISQFISAWVVIVIAGAFAVWYWTKDKKSIASTSPVWTAFKIGTWYHLGTVAFGSLTIAIIKFIRYLVAEVQAKLEKATGKDNKLVKFAFCCLQCCLWCFEKFMKFLNKNAYIQTAIFGTNFLVSAKNAFFLIIRNVLIVSVVNFVSDFVILLGKLFIATLTCLIAFLMVTYANDKLVDDIKTNPISSPILVAALLFLIGWAVGSLFMNVFQVGIDTIMQSFILDLEMNEGKEHFASGELDSFFKDEEAENKKNHTPAENKA